MPHRDPFVLGPTGTPFSRVGSSNIFEKDVLIEGEYQHPISPWDEPLRATREYIDALCRNSNAAMAAGQRVYVPDGHSNKAKDNTGFSLDFTPRFEAGKWRAKARIQIEDPVYVSKIGTTIRDVSPLIVNYPLGDGKDFGERIAHVALVPDPVMPGQGNFVACSLGGGTLESVEVPVLKPVPTSGAAPMKVKITDSNIKALSLVGITGKVGDEVEVAVEAFEKALSLSFSARNEAETAKAAQKTAEDALAAEKAKPPVPIEKALSVDAKATPYFGEARSARAKALSTALDAAMKRGAINATLRGHFEKILSVRHGYAMAESGVAESVDVAAAAEALLGAIPDGAVVPIGEAMKTAGASPGTPPPATAPAFDAVKEADRALVLAGFKSPPTAAPTK